jgi:hypothetical protein
MYWGQDRYQNEFNQNIPGFTFNSSFDADKCQMSDFKLIHGTNVEPCNMSSGEDPRHHALVQDGDELFLKAMSTNRNSSEVHQGDGSMDDTRGVWLTGVGWQAAKHHLATFKNDEGVYCYIIFDKTHPQWNLMSVVQGGSDGTMVCRSAVSGATCCFYDI